VWSDEIDATLDDVFAVQEWVATQIVEALDVRLGPGEAGSLGTFGTRSAAAYDEYLRGLKVSEDFHPRGLAAALGHFERAARIDPQFAQALASQASAEARVYRNVDGNPEHLERAKALVERTLAIDSGLSRALFASGEVRAATYDYQGAAEVFRQVVALEPRSYIAWDSLCWALGYVTPPQTTEAEKACRQSIEVNPAFDGSYYHLERVLLQGGRLAEAQQALTQLEQRFPDSPTIRPGRFWFSMGAKRPQEALTLLEQERVLEGTALGLAWRALALAQLGELDRSLRRLDEALAHGYRDLAALRGDPYLEPLRRDPRFAALLAKYHLPSQAPPSLREGGTLPSRSTSDLGPHINRPAEAEAPWDSPRSAHAVPGD
jgi:adenylate cyclase